MIQDGSPSTTKPKRCSSVHEFFYDLQNASTDYCKKWMVVATYADLKAIDN